MIQHLTLLDEAKLRGIRILDVSDLMRKPAALLEHDSHAELVIDGVPMSWINVRGQFFCDNKQLTKIAYQALNIPHPKSIIFSTFDQDRIGTFLKLGNKYVCKPLDNTNGIGVQLNIDSLNKVRDYLNTHQDIKPPFLLEEQVFGKDLRIHVINGQIVAACIREPAFVTGNGQDNLNGLIEKRRAIMKTQNPNNFLDIDEATQRLLAQQHVTLSDVPEAGQKIQLKEISNMAQGGHAIDVTDSIHPVFQTWVSQLSKYLNTGYFGLDLITTDYHDQAAENTQVLEINARADWLHHTFSEGRRHDMAGKILNALF